MFFFQTKTKRRHDKHNEIFGAVLIGFSRGGNKLLSNKDVSRYSAFFFSRRKEHSLGKEKNRTIYGEAGGFGEDSWSVRSLENKASEKSKC